MRSQDLQEVDRILIPQEEIANRLRQIAEDLAADLKHSLAGTGDDHLNHADRVVFIPIMTGALVLTADLIRLLPIRLSIRLVTVSSYAGATTESRGASIQGALPDNLEGRHIVILDDILDSGKTLHAVRSAVETQNPASVRSVVLLDKAERREIEVPCEHVGFNIPNEFVVGYGLDYDGYYRNLPDIVALKPDAFG
jgi:hypoxanthine phosphoribosyltransferase